MRTTGFRSMVLYILLAAFLGGLGYLLYQFVVNGSQWAMQPYNGHVYSENSTVKLGDITDRDGNLLATTEDGARLYSQDETVRRSLLHTVGDPYGYISTSVQYTMRAQLSGYNIITGLNDTIFNRMGSDIALTIDQDACVAAYNALGGKNGAVIVYNYETGEILAKVSAPTFDPNAVPEDLETNEAYKGVYVYGHVRVEGGLPRIVADAEWDAAQDERRRMSVKHRRHVYVRPGMQFGHLQVVESAGTAKHHAKWLCECKACGSTKVEWATRLTSGKAQDCGCLSGDGRNRDDLGRFK